MISPGGRPINEAPIGTGKNWVTKVGGLPPYIRGVARGIAKKHGGKVTSRDIAIAVARMKFWAAGGGHVHPQVQAAAAAAVAEWEAKRAKSHALSNVYDFSNAVADWNMDEVRSAYEKQERARRDAKRIARMAQVPGPIAESDEDYKHVKEVHSNHVIVGKGYGDSKAHLKVPYDVQPDGSFKFGKEQPVEQRYVALSSAVQRVIDLAAAGGHHIKGTAYHWKHGWHPQDRSTALQYGKSLKGLESSKFHNVEPEEFNSATSKTPKFISGNHDVQPVMKYRKDKILTGTTHTALLDPKKPKGALGNHKKITIAGVSESNTHVIDTEGKKHPITHLTGHTEADTAALSNFQKKKFKGAIKTYQIKSGFAPAPKPYKLPAKHKSAPSEPLALPEVKKNHYNADPHHFGEPTFPVSKSLNEPNVSPKLTAKELAAVKSYTGSGYTTINNELRHHPKPEGEAPHPTVAAIDSAIAKATPFNELAPGHLHRGFSVAALAGLQPGDSFVDKGFVSTSRHHSVSQDFGGGTTRIHIDSAHPDLKALDVYGISQHPNEKEVLLPRNTKFTVKHRVDHGGHAHLYVHAEPANAAAAKPKRVKKKVAA